MNKHRKPYEGVKYCQHNHNPFRVIGYYDVNGNWQTIFVMPR